MACVPHVVKVRLQPGVDTNKDEEKRFLTGLTG
jgi:hypothetical protein